MQKLNQCQFIARLAFLEIYLDRIGPFPLLFLEKADFGWLARLPKANKWEKPVFFPVHNPIFNVLKQ